MTKRELIDFMKWLNQPRITLLECAEFDALANDYLKSNNSQAPDKSQIISENEANEVFCELCGGVIEPWSKHYTRCDKCIGLC